MAEYQQTQRKLNTQEDDSETKLLQKKAQAPHTNSRTMQLQAQQVKANKYAQKKASKQQGLGLPIQLQEGIESLSGQAMDGVKVHRNSKKPAELNAHAYAQGDDIHLAPGQEQHLPHEAWHVVQQRQGRVQPTRQLKDKVAINDDSSLEQEADVMGARAMSFTGAATKQLKGVQSTNQEHIQRQHKSTGTVAQCVLKFNKPLVAGDVVSVKRVPNKSVFILKGANNDALIIKFEGHAQSESNEDFKARSESIEAMAFDILPNLPGSVNLNAADIAQINAINLPGNNDLGMLKQLVADHAFMQNNLALKKEFVEVDENFLDIANKDLADSLTMSKRDKKKKPSTKSYAILNNKDILRSMGRAAAFDLFIGNSDRFRADPSDTNLENIDFNATLSDMVALDQLDTYGFIIANDGTEQAWEGEAILSSASALNKYVAQAYMSMLQKAGLDYDKNTEVNVQHFISGVHIALILIKEKVKVIKMMSKRGAGNTPQHRALCKILLARIQKLI